MQLLDQCGSVTALAYPKKNPAIHPVAKKLFTSTGKEIKSVRELNYDEELWLSFGEPWRDPQSNCHIFICTFQNNSPHDMILYEVYLFSA